MIFNKIRIKITTLSFGIICFIFAMMIQSPACAQDICLYYVEGIEDIVIAGNSRINSSFIKAHIKQSSHKCLDREEASSKIINILFKTGFFKDISLKISDNTMFLDVVENPVIKKISFEGLSAFKEKVVFPEILLEENKVLSDNMLQISINNLLELYKKSGYFFTKVDVERKNLTKDTEEIIFNILEGNISKIKSIKFVGNNDIPESELKSLLRSKTSSLFSFISKNNVYDGNKVIMDEEILRSLYLSKGYADFSIVSSITDISLSGIDLSFIIHEGDVYKIKDITLENNVPSLDDNEINKKITLKPDEIFNLRNIYQVHNEIIQYLGKFKNDIKVDLDYIPDGTQMTVKFIVTENSPKYIDRIIIKGNSRTSDAVIRQEISVHEGDLFTESKKNDTENSLKALEFFESVVITELSNSTFKDKLDLIIEVKEKPTGDIGVSGGYSTGQGLVANLSYSEKNLFGTGSKLSLGLQKASHNFSLNADFERPHIIGNTSGSVSGYYNRNSNNRHFITQSIGGSLALSAQLKKHWYYTTKYMLDTQSLVNLSEAAKKNLKDHKEMSFTSAIKHAVLYDALDNSINPRNGLSINFTQDFAGLAGDRSYLRTTSAVNFFKNKIPIGILNDEDVVFKLSSTFGNIYNYSENPLAPTDRFNSHEASLRGFETSGIGPRISKAGTPLGGEFMSVSSAQLNFPLKLPMIKQNNFRGSVFIDAGAIFGIENKILSNLRNNNYDIMDSSSLRISAGLGLVWLSPFGPMRVNFAAPLLKQEFDIEKNFSLSMGIF